MFFFFFGIDLAEHLSLSSLWMGLIYLNNFCLHKALTQNLVAGSSGREADVYKLWLWVFFFLTSSSRSGCIRSVCVWGRSCSRHGDCKVNCQFLCACSGTCMMLNSCWYTGIFCRNPFPYGEQVTQQGNDCLCESCVESLNEEEPRSKPQVPTPFLPSFSCPIDQVINLSCRHPFNVTM